MKLSEYIKEFGDKQVDVDKLSEFIIEDRVWLPKENEKYYFVDYVGDVMWLFNDDSIDKSIIDYQQVYRTEAEAEFARDKAIFKEFMRKEFLRNSDELDWYDGLQDKYKISCNFIDKVVFAGWNSVIKDAVLYTTNREWLEQFMKEHEDDIKKYYFEVE